TALRVQDLECGSTAHSAVAMNGRELFQGQLGALGVVMGIGAESQVDSLCRVTQVKVRRFSETAGADRPKLALVTAATGHVEFVNDQASGNIGHSHVQSEKRAARTQISEKEPRERAPAIHTCKITFH